MIGNIDIFNWKEAVNNAKGQSSAGLFLCFFYGIVLILLALIAGITYFVKWIEKSDINNIFIFVGVQFPFILGYLSGHKYLDKDEIPKNTTEVSITKTETSQ